MLAVRPVLSVTVMMLVTVPGVIGVPVMIPVFLSKKRPSGNAVLVQDKGAVPPVAVKVTFIPKLAVIAGMEAVVITMGLAMIMLSCLVTFSGTGAESESSMVKLKVPAVVGLPLITPVAAFRMSPAGKLSPTLSAQTYGAAPPVPVKVSTYPA